jgi:hypothetical protein
VPFFILLIAFSSFAKSAHDFEGIYINRHSISLTSENRTVHNVEDIVRIQPVDTQKANILIETYTQNYHSCQLIGEATLKGDALVFTSSVDKRLNRGNKATCIIRISQTQNEAGDKIVKVEDQSDNCKLRYCGMTAELGGDFKQKSVLVQDKN